MMAMHAALHPCYGADANVGLKTVGGYYLARRLSSVPMPRHDNQRLEDERWQAFNVAMHFSRYNT